FSNGADPSHTGEPAWNADVPPLTGPARPYDLDEAYAPRSPYYRDCDQEGVAAEDWRPGGHARRQTYFEEVEEAAPEDAKRPWRALITLYLFLAMLGSAGGALWHYYGPDPAASASARDVERLAASLAQVEQEQRRLTETVRALQSGHDQLAQALAAREQEIQRLVSESNALKAALDAMHNAPAAAARSAHGTGRSSPASGPKKKAD